MTHYSGYSEDQIQPVFKLMVDYLRRPVTHEAFFKKYASKKFLKGKLSPLLISLTLADEVPASILTRQWAKKYHPMYLDTEDNVLGARDINAPIVAPTVKGR